MSKRNSHNNKSKHSIIHLNEHIHKNIFQNIQFSVTFYFANGGSASKTQVKASNTPSKKEFVMKQLKIKLKNLSVGDIEKIQTNVRRIVFDNSFVFLKQLIVTSSTDFK